MELIAVGMGAQIGYNHGQVAEMKLADSGWHCTFCFRYLHDFVDKMIGASSLCEHKAMAGLC